MSASWLLVASLAPVCVKCHHAGCVIACRVRASAGAILAVALIASDSLRPSPAACCVTAIRAVGCRTSDQEARKAAIMTTGTTSRTAREPAG
jgi:hypothetical protein